MQVDAFKHLQRAETLGYTFDVYHIIYIYFLIKFFLIHLLSVS